MDGFQAAGRRIGNRIRQAAMPPAEMIPFLLGFPQKKIDPVCCGA